MDRDVFIVGTGIIPMNRRDRAMEDMSHQVVAEALADAQVDPADVNLVVFGNAMAGRLVDQGCLRGQSFLRQAGLRNAGVVNIDNSCGGGASALHMATLATLGGSPTVLAVGVEKMWTGDRSQTLAGIEDGVPLVERLRMHRELENPSGSVLMALNASWCVKQMEERDATPEQFAAAAVKSRYHGSLNPNAQFQSEITIEEVLASPSIVPPLTRLMCSSFTDGAAAAVLSLTKSPGAPRIRTSTIRSGNGDMDYHERLAEAALAAWEDAGIDPNDADLVELHDATSAEELYALESLGFFKPGDAGPATLAGDTRVGGRGVTVNTSGGLVARGHPLGATGIAQIVELTTQLRGQAGARQVEGARLAIAANTGGIIGTDAGFIGIHVLEGG
ncbi:MAG TPA: thiolase family protein [Acidimicrobiales bacterium]|jgi:acetyl-CoA acetyltransferase|nr:thiolase family protein [Acidimicrobiales bacterium]